ncbi:MAG: hypothetical protein ABEJ24_02425 [Candidatus Magasanikbacteria bacterium]
MANYLESEPYKEYYLREDGRILDRLPQSKNEKEFTKFTLDELKTKGEIVVETESRTIKLICQSISGTYKIQEDSRTVMEGSFEKVKSGIRNETERG